MFRRKWRMTKIVGCFLSVLICISAIASCANYRVKAAPSTDQIMFGQYYRIRHSRSSFYLTMDSTANSDGIGCSLNARNDYNQGQIFYLGINNDTNTYYLSPRSAPSKALTLVSSGYPGDIPIVLKNLSSLSTQNWNISRTTPGFYIKSYANGRAIAPKGLSNSKGTEIVGSTYSIGSTDWRFEPAYSGSASYFMTASDLSSSNSVIVNDAVSKIKALGYDCERADLPVTGHIRFATPGNRLTVFHGHGSPGHMKLDQKEGDPVRMYSENAPSGNLTLNFSTTKNSLVVFIVCKSATASSNRMSLQDAAWCKGANTVMAFKNSVTGGERFLKYVINYMSLYPHYTVNQAASLAQSHYSADDLKESTCPANTENLDICGLPISVNMN